MIQSAITRGTYIRIPQKSDALISGFGKTMRHLFPNGPDKGNKTNLLLNNKCQTGKHYNCLSIKVKNY